MTILNTADPSNAVFRIHNTHAGGGESDRIFVAVVRFSGNGLIQFGYSVFHRTKPKDKFNLDALRHTAETRLQVRAITAYGPPTKLLHLLPPQKVSTLIRRRGIETKKEHAERIAAEHDARCRLWREIMTPNAIKEFHRLPTPITRAADEPVDHYKARKAMANAKFMEAFPNAVVKDDESQIDALRAKKEWYREKMEMFVREIISENPIRHISV